MDRNRSSPAYEEEGIHMQSPHKTSEELTTQKNGLNIPDSMTIRDRDSSNVDTSHDSATQHIYTYIENIV